MQVKQNGRLLCAHELVELIADSMNDAILVKIVAQSSRCEKNVPTLFFIFSSAMSFSWHFSGGWMFRRVFVLRVFGHLRRLITHVCRLYHPTAFKSAKLMAKVVCDPEPFKGA